MKKLNCTLGLGLLITLLGLQMAPATDAPASAAQLRSELESALKAKDTNAVLALVNWQGVAAEMKSDTSAVITAEIGRDLASVKLLPLPADYQATNELNGVRYFPNVRVLGMIKLQSKKEGESADMPYGESGGGFYVAGMIQETFNSNAKKAVSLGVMVMGLFPKDSPGILRCSYVYVTGGEEKSGGFLCTNNWSVGFWGDAFKSGKVTKVSGDGAFGLQLNEAGKTVFDSDLVATNDVIVYEKK